MTLLPARQNETVTLRIRADRAGDVHVHGYDQNVTLRVGSEVVYVYSCVATLLIYLFIAGIPGHCATGASARVRRAVWEC
jgi:hypothetical protein